MTTILFGNLKEWRFKLARRVKSIKNLLGIENPPEKMPDRIGGTGPWPGGTFNGTGGTRNGS